jgi:hypothetical protein
MPVNTDRAWNRAASLERPVRVRATVTVYIIRIDRVKINDTETMETI